MRLVSVASPPLSKISRAPGAPAVSYVHEARKSTSEEIVFSPVKERFTVSVALKLTISPGTPGAVRAGSELTQAPAASQSEDPSTQENVAGVCAQAHRAISPHKQNGKADFGMSGILVRV